MIANSKRFKNEIEFLRRRVVDNLYDDFFTLSAYVVFGKNVWGNNGIRLQFYYRMDCNKRFMTYENAADGIVYFGIDLRNAAFKYDTTQLVEEVYYDRIQWAKDPQSDPFFKGYVGPFYEIRNNRNLVKNLPEFQKLLAQVQDVNNRGKAEVTLKDDQWPKLKNREMLPIAWVDFSKSKMSMTTDNYVNSFRKGNLTVDIGQGVEDYMTKRIRPCPRLVTSTVTT